jgi:hypothetical protein
MSWLLINSYNGDEYLFTPAAGSTTSFSISITAVTTYIQVHGFSSQPTDYYLYCSIGTVPTTYGDRIPVTSVMPLTLLRQLFDCMIIGWLIG